MNINELGEDLEQRFGKPRNITEENVRFMLSLIKEEFDGTKVNENIEKQVLKPRHDHSCCYVIPNYTLGRIGKETFNPQDTQIYCH